jgi:hypothetical protein
VFFACVIDTILPLLGLRIEEVIRDRYDRLPAVPQRDVGCIGYDGYDTRQEHRQADRQEKAVVFIFGFE